MTAYEQRARVANARANQRSLAAHKEAARHAAQRIERWCTPQEILSYPLRIRMVYNKDINCNAYTAEWLQKRLRQLHELRDNAPRQQRNSPNREAEIARIEAYLLQAVA